MKDRAYVFLCSPSRPSARKRTNCRTHRRAESLVWRTKQALQVKDVKVLDLLLGGEFIDIECDGTMTNKAEYLANVKAPTVQLEHIVNESMQVQFYGRTAVDRYVLGKGHKKWPGVFVPSALQ